MPLRILLVDDNVPLRLGMKMLLRDDPEIEIVGEAGDGTTAVRLAVELLPDVILMDVHMLGMDGIEATHQILHGPNPAPLLPSGVPIRVITFSSADATQAHAMTAAGATGHLSKSATSDLRAALRAALATPKPHRPQP